VKHRVPRLGCSSHIPLRRRIVIPLDGARVVGALARTFSRRFIERGARPACVFLRYGVLRLWVRVRNRLGGVPRVECPCCGWRGQDFYPLDVITFLVPRVFCPHCNCQERHRLFRLYVERGEPELLRREGRGLHFAPVSHERDFLASRGTLRWVAADVSPHTLLQARNPRFQADIQRMPITDDAFSCVLCFHVLEHVPDDWAATRELARVLEPGGTAYIMVPFMVGSPETEEWGRPDPALFGHRRAYSMADFEERLAPFEHEAIVPTDFLSEEQAYRYGIPTDSQVIYRCAKKIDPPEPACAERCAPGS